MPEQRTIPLIYFAYANPANDLDALSTEIREHRRICNPSLSDGKFRFHQDIGFGLEQVDEFLKDYGTSVTIFHFSGHADKRCLELKDANAFVEPFANRLKTALRESQKMVMFFLNGCLTADHARLLWNAGVPIVIGTNEWVNDKRAAQFSIRFCEEFIGNRHSVKHAFEQALLQFKTSAEPGDDEEERGVVPYNGKKNADEDKYGESGYQLFVRPGAAYEHFAHYQLGGDFDRLVLRKRDEKRPNEHLINELCKTLLKVNFSGVMGYAAEWIAKLQKNETPDFSQAKDAIPRAFPFIVEDDLRRLLQRGSLLAEFSQERFYHLVKIYHNLCELMLLIWFSQLWEACKDKGNDCQDLFSEPLGGSSGTEKQAFETWRNQLFHDFKTFFDIKKPERIFVDLVPYIQNIRKLCLALGIQPVVNEFVDLATELRTDTKFDEAYQFMRKAQQNLQDHTLNFNQPEALFVACKQAEAHLTYVLQKAAFCCKYDLLVVKNIGVKMFRDMAHPIFKLNIFFSAKENPKFYGKEKSTYNAKPNCAKSVLLAKVDLEKHLPDDDDDTEEYLTDEAEEYDLTIKSGVAIDLTPFVVDLKAFDDGLEKFSSGGHSDNESLLVFSHVEVEGESRVYYYHSAYEPGRTPVAIAKKHPAYSVVHRGMKRFLKIFSTPLPQQA